MRIGRRELEAVQQVGYCPDWILESPKPIFCQRGSRCLFNRDMSKGLDASDAEMLVFSCCITRSQADVSQGNRRRRRDSIVEASGSKQVVDKVKASRRVVADDSSLL